MKTSDKILDYIKLKKQVSPKELVDYLEISQRAVFKQLKKLFESSELLKIGRPPKVFYTLPQKKVVLSKPNIPTELSDFIGENFYYISPLGEEKIGVSGFDYWCQRQNLPIEKTAVEYMTTLKRYHNHKKEGLIHALSKMETTFPSIYLEDLIYLDFYAIERFGKTKLGQQLLLAKQSQSRPFIRALINEIRGKLEKIIKDFKIDCIGFIPPTVKREIQIMDELKKELHFNLPLLKITKIKTPIIVPQKTLNKLNDRIENAKRTIIVEDRRKYKSILLIDDAVGSGATLQETSKQIKENKNCKTLIGLSITGSFKGFDVISEV